MKYNFTLQIIISLMITIVLELLGSLIVGVRNKKDLLNIILVNILTNPLLNSIVLFVNVLYGIFYRNIVLYILEILVVIVEGVIYKKYLSFKKINPFLLSLILNITSYGLGLLINKIIY